MENRVWMAVDMSPLGYDLSESGQLITEYRKYIEVASLGTNRNLH